MVPVLQRSQVKLVCVWEPLDDCELLESPPSELLAAELSLLSLDLLPFESPPELLSECPSELPLAFEVLWESVLVELPFEPPESLAPDSL